MRPLSPFRASFLLAFALMGLEVPASAAEAALAGRWEAVVSVDGVEVPFPFEIEVDTGVAGTTVRGSFFNGERRVTSTWGGVDGGHLTLRFDQYATSLDVTLDAGALVGEYRRTRGPYPFRAVRAEAKTKTTPQESAPEIEGVWIVGARSNKGEAAWRFIVRQDGARVEGTLLRVDGDTGTLSGVYQDGRFLLSHFSGARPLLLEVTPAVDGTLLLRQNGKTELVAAREGTARAQAFGAPTDPSQHTWVERPEEPFRFAFHDLDGRLVSNTDPRFSGRVVLVSISGSWCPNCHDEAPFLAALHRKYQSQGLEIVTLSFEEADQLEDPVRLRAFIKNYGIGYTVLLAGEPAELADKLPQATHLNAFPTTFILGRDGRVRGVHAGFPSPGSGAFYARATSDLTSIVETLLAEDF